MVIEKFMIHLKIFGCGLWFALGRRPPTNVVAPVALPPSNLRNFRCFGIPYTFILPDVSTSWVD